MAKRAYDAAFIRSVAIVGHRSAGKTSLGDSLLHAAGVTRARGDVRQQTSLLDHEPEERSKGWSLGPAFAWMDWSDHLLQIVDTPGADGLEHERRVATSGVDGALIVVSGPDGLEIGTEAALSEARAAGLPAAFVLNKLDRRCDIEGVRLSLERASGARVLPLQVPFYDDIGQFAGVVSLLKRKALRYDPDGSGTYSVEPMPDRVRNACGSAWERVMEVVALTDDELLEHYLEYLELPVEMVREGLARGMKEGRIIPMLFASAEKNIGAHAVLDLAVWAFPAPESNKQAPFAARILASRLDEDDQPYHVMRIIQGLPKRGMRWTVGDEHGKVRKLYQVRGPRRTMAVNMGPGCIVATWDRLPGRPGDVITDGTPLEELQPVPAPAHMAAWLLRPRRESDSRRLNDALEELCSMDLGLRVEIEPLSSLPVLRGVTDSHLNHAVHVLEKRLGVAVSTQLEPVAYREVPARAASGVQGLHRVASGDDVAAYGECFIDVEPADPDAPVAVEIPEYIDESIPTRFHDALRQGLAQGLRSGPTAGYPVVGAHIRVTNGEYDIFMSEPEHFALAGAQASEDALQQTSTHLVEPWSLIEVTLPANEVGDVLNDLAAHRGRILGMEVKGPVAVVRAHSPDREIRTFGPRLQAISGGRGCFTASHSHYGWLPAQYVREAIDASPFRGDAGRPEPGTPKPAPRDVRPFNRDPSPVVRGAKV